jgi:Ala-tRNA(Pro) deacylase
MITIEQKILEFLNHNQIEYEVREHEPVYTSVQMAKFLETDEDHIAKSMILKNNNEYLLAVLPGKLKINFSRLGAILGAKSICLASASEAENIAKCAVGSVHPFGNLLNLRTYFDQKLLNTEYVFFNPGSHTKSIKIRTTDLLTLVKPSVIEFTKSADQGL